MMPCAEEDLTIRDFTASGSIDYVLASELASILDLDTSASAIICSNTYILGFINLWGLIDHRILSIYERYVCSANLLAAPIMSSRTKKSMNLCSQSKGTNHANLHIIILCFSRIINYGHYQYKKSKYLGTRQTL